MKQFAFNSSIKSIAFSDKESKYTPIMETVQENYRSRFKDIMEDKSSSSNKRSSMVDLPSYDFDHLIIEEANQEKKPR